MSDPFQPVKHADLDDALSRRVRVHLKDARPGCVWVLEALSRDKHHALLLTPSTRKPLGVSTNRLMYARGYEPKGGAS